MYTYHSLGAIKADNLFSGQEYSLLTKLSYSKSPPPSPLPPSHHLSPPMEKLSETRGDYDLVMQLFYGFKAVSVFKDGNSLEEGCRHNVDPGGLCLGFKLCQLCHGYYCTQTDNGPVLLGNFQVW